ncbi:MAG TPA: DUF559 domain-containing protein [Thermoanaerobaculia bacterium]|nr:DUF559 domain-containing protein [Thermoanaerobaculia bacterium]
MHDTDAQIAHDQNRGDYLRSLGYYILRFPNEAILLDSRAVIEEITQTARRLRPALAR